jgi:hypothetical protein
MIGLKWMLMAAGAAMFGSAASVVAYDVYLAMQFQRLLGSTQPGPPQKATAHYSVQPALVLKTAQGMKHK